jgi:acetyl-CoA acetyltransferase
VRRGWTVAEHRAHLGRLCARLAATAATHPQAWSRRALTIEEIVTPSAENRMVAFPYPKRMTANIDVDQAAAVLLTSVGTARALGIPESRWVFLHGAAEAKDVWLVTALGARRRLRLARRRHWRWRDSMCPGWRSSTSTAAFRVRSRSQPASSGSLTTTRVRCR